MRPMAHVGDVVSTHASDRSAASWWAGANPAAHLDQEVSLMPSIVT
jgi:hypothetical protein